MISDEMAVQLAAEIERLRLERDAALARADHAERNLQAADAMALIDTSPLTPMQYAAGAEIGATLERELIRDFVECANEYGWPAWAVLTINGELCVVCRYCRAEHLAGDKPLTALAELEHTPTCPVQRGRLWLSAARHAVSPEPVTRVERLIACAREWALLSAVFVTRANDSRAEYDAMVKAERELHAAARAFGDAP